MALSGDNIQATVEFDSGPLCGVMRAEQKLSVVKK
jgi:hypothetical protein